MSQPVHCCRGCCCGRGAGLHLLSAWGGRAQATVAWGGTAAVLGFHMPGAGGVAAVLRLQVQALWGSTKRVLVKKCCLACE
jgi:hypothetical protein